MTLSSSKPTPSHTRTRRTSSILVSLLSGAALLSGCAPTLSGLTIPSPHLVGVTLFNVQRGPRPVECPVDPVLRKKVDRPSLPTSLKQGDWIAFSIGQEAAISIAEARKDLAVRTIDICNQVNKSTPKPKAWWHVW